MANLGALNWFESFIKKLKKALDCINHVIYTPDNGCKNRNIFVTQAELKSTHFEISLWSLCVAHTEKLT